MRAGGHRKGGRGRRGGDTRHDDWRKGPERGKAGGGGLIWCRGKGEAGFARVGDGHGGFFF